MGWRRDPAAPGGAAPDDPVALAAYLEGAAEALSEPFGLHPGWVDARNAEDTLGLVTEHVWPVLSGQLLGCALRPVTGPEREPEQQAAAGAVGAEWGNGLGIRVRGVDAHDARVSARVEKLVERAGVPPEETDLLVDLWEVGAVEDAVSLGERAWQAVGTMAPWRTAVLLGGSFPWDVEPLKSGKVTPLLRVEWAVWRNLRAARERGGCGGQEPGFVYGDYSAVSPRSCDAPAKARPPRVYEKPRYTTSEYFLVGKGRQWGRSGEESCMRSLVASMVEDPEFRWDHSDGEIWLQERAVDEANESVGTPETWVTNGHVQHLTFVAEQLRGLAR